jgi:hypothetical protein
VARFCSAESQDDDERWIGNGLKEAVVVYFKGLSRHLPGGIKESHEKPQSI